MTQQTTILPSVLTLEEVAHYLRLPADVVERQAVKGQIPGRQIENSWRFLKVAIDDWLRGQSSRSLLLQQAGSFADDEMLHELRDTIYAHRGRPETEEATP